VNVIHRVWRTWAAPAGSDAALWLQVLVPLEAVAYVYQLLAPEGWPPFGERTPLQVFSWCLTLWFVRQRDAARAEIKGHEARNSSGVRHAD
jgi:hypothetical protein